MKNFKSLIDLNLYVFIIKGVVRDRSRSLFPIIIVAIFVTIIVFFKGFMTGMMDGMLKTTAVISSGHVKITTNGFNEDRQLLPNDLALIEIDSFIDRLDKDFPEFFWEPRIVFAGLLDVPDDFGETKNQGPVLGYGIDILSDDSKQHETWNLSNKLLSGRLPSKYNEVLMSNKLANSLALSTGDTVTFIGSTMDGAFTTFNYTLVGTLSMGIGATDKNMMILDISGAQEALDMQDSCSEILGFNSIMYYDDEMAMGTRDSFNKQYNDKDDIFSPTMIAMRDANQIGVMIDINNAASLIFMSVFLAIVTIVLWNMGLMNGMRRYGEIGMRLAIGESKGKVFMSMVVESGVIGLIGTAIGTLLGLGLTLYLQEYGLDYSQALQNLKSTSIVMTNIIYARVTSDLYYIGFVPGVIATMFGTMLAGRSIYKREMSQLFKELET